MALSTQSDFFRLEISVYQLHYPPSCSFARPPLSLRTTVRFYSLAYINRCENPQAEAARSGSASSCLFSLTRTM